MQVTDKITKSVPHYAVNDANSVILKPGHREKRITKAFIEI